jgi:hypothetical protein
MESRAGVNPAPTKTSVGEGFIPPFRAFQFAGVVQEAREKRIGVFVGGPKGPVYKRDSEHPSP